MKTKPKIKRHKHNWLTVHSFGVWGHVAKCDQCGKQTTFIIKETI